MKSKPEIIIPSNYYNKSWKVAFWMIAIWITIRMPFRIFFSFFRGEYQPASSSPIFGYINLLIYIFSFIFVGFLYSHEKQKRMDKKTVFRASVYVALYFLLRKFFFIVTQSDFLNNYESFKIFLIWNTPIIILHFFLAKYLLILGSKLYKNPVVSE